MGLTLLLTFLLTGNGLGASGFVTRLTAQIGLWIAPAATAANAYFGPFAQAGNVMATWITWEVIGVFIGGLLGALSAGRARLQIEKGAHVGSGRRLALALLGGALVGFGGRLARGCTSGVGLSGGATLAVAGFVFLAGFFAAGFLVTALTRRVWR